MRFSNRFYTFMIAGHADAKVRRISLSYPLLLAIGFFATLGMVTVAAAAYHWCRMIVRVQEYDHLLAENDSFRAENQSFGVQTAILGEKIDFLETLAHKVSAISGINAVRSVGGVGGLSRETFRQSLPSATPSLSSFERYGRSVDDLEQRYRGMSEFFFRKVLLTSAMPDRMPVKGYVSGGMGLREDPFNGARTVHHDGVDISAPYGSPVRAPADGVVMFAGHREGYGNIVVLNHRFGMVTRYGHLSRMSVKAGQRVCRSEVIGYVGTSGRTTGPHLHYEVLSHNVLRDPKRFLSHPDAE